MKLKTLAEKYNYTCYYCKWPFRLSELSRDHIIRVRDLVKMGIIKKAANKKYSKAIGHFGGKNLRLACKVCNLQRD